MNLPEVVVWCIGAVLISTLAYRSALQSTFTYHALVAMPPHAIHSDHYYLILPFRLPARYANRVPSTKNGDCFRGSAGCSDILQRPADRARVRGSVGGMSKVQ